MQQKPEKLAKTVLVVSAAGKMLPNTDCAKARKLLKCRKARILERQPFKIQLCSPV